MDISEVYMVRSAKGNDMLCVDSFLYYYDDRGLNTYRWSCNKRKDKVSPCRARIITKLLDMDETKHTVVKTFGEHTHERCSAEGVSIAFERKRLANLEGKPCTLEAKAEKRKFLRSQYDSEDNSIPIEQKRMKVVSDSRDIKVEHNSACLEDSKCNESIVTEFKDTNIYMLKTSHGRDMVCIDGYLYRLEGKSTHAYRWECTRRRDDGCKARVQTLRVHDRRHVLKQKRLGHTHPPYAQEKLLKLFQKHYVNSPISQPKNEQSSSNDQVFDNIEEFEEINLANSSELLKEMLEPANENNDLSAAYIKSDSLQINDFEEIIDEDNCNEGTLNEKDTELEKEPNYTEDEKEPEGEDPLEGSGYVKQPDLDLTKVCLLPSSKGNKLLCIDSFLYHFDSRSAHRPRIYWTCIHRRDKVTNCKARITTDGDIDNDLKIVKISGLHIHPNDADKIKQRLCNQFVIRAANAIDMKPSEFLNSSIQELNGAVKEMVINSMGKIRKKISKLRYKMKQKRLINSKYRIEEDNDSITSLTSDLYSDDDVELPLPMNLEQMKAEIQEDPKEKDYDSDLAASCHTEEFINEHELIKEYECVNMNLNGEVYEHFKESLSDRNGDKVEYGERGKEEEEEGKKQIPSDMNLRNISTLRSAKGGELLCVDNFLYHVKSIRDTRTYWECIKCKNKAIKCKSRLITVMSPKGYVIIKVTNEHSHIASRADVEKRVLRNLRKAAVNSAIFPKDTISYNSKMKLLAHHDFKEELETHMAEMEKIATIRTKMRKYSAETRSVMKLYSVSDGPPSLAVRMTLKALKIPYELVNIDFCAGEHMTDEYAEMNPQKEIPVLDDDGFYLSESIAIMQYLCDKYAPHSPLYPKEVSKRAVVNQRLCFNMGFYYSSISAHVMAPIFFDYPRTEMSLKKVNNSLSVFETYFERTGTKYAAANYLTIADFPLVTATLCLEAIGFDLIIFPLVKQWYETFKEEYPQLWEIGSEGMKEIKKFEENPPDLSNMNHPFHPTRKYNYGKV